jgi:hypothetical protein
MHPTVLPSIKAAKEIREVTEVKEAKQVREEEQLQQVLRKFQYESRFTQLAARWSESRL